MKRSSLPSPVDARKLASNGAFFQTLDEVGRFERFADGLADRQGDVSTELNFYRDEQGGYRLDMKLDASVKLLCQRCLEPMDANIGVNAQLQVVWTEAQMQALPRELDGVIQEDDQLDLQAVVEDELIVATPYTSYHETDACGPQRFESFDEESETEHQVKDEQDNPFAVLKSMKEET